MLLSFEVHEFSSVHLASENRLPIQCSLFDNVVVPLNLPVTIPSESQSSVNARSCLVTHLFPQFELQRTQMLARLESKTAPKPR